MQHHEKAPAGRITPLSRDESKDEDPEHVGSDAWIQRYVDEHIVHTSRESSVHEVLVEVKHGHVTLIGTVPHRAMKQSLEALVADTPGVIKVDNRLRVALTGPWPEDSAT